MRIEKVENSENFDKPQESVSCPQRVNILGVGISTLTPNLATRFLENYVRSGITGYVCVTGVHGIMESQKDERLRLIINNATLAVPDGMPTVWYGKLQGFHHMQRTYGPDLMLDICKASLSSGHTHFLYGGREGVAEQLKRALEERFPGIRIVGTYTPPFRPLEQQEEQELVDMVESLKPDYFWVGLSTPKQEKFMAAHSHLSVGIQIGVGAAFDIHTGNLKDSPPWIKSMGLQWLHRLIQEPRRLWKRYLLNNPVFVCKILLQYLKLRQYDLNG